MNIASIGIDLGKTTFHLVALGERNKILLRRKFSRSQLLAYTANLPASLIGLEACAGAHFMGAALREQGHQVRLIPAQFVKPYRKSNKNDFIDAEAIAEAVAKQNMRFVHQTFCSSVADQTLSVIEIYRQLWPPFGIARNTCTMRPFPRGLKENSMRFVIALITLAFAACSTTPVSKSQAASPGQGPASEEPKPSTDSPMQFLLRSAATDFHAHRPPLVERFRDVHFGHVMTPAGAAQYQLCGEFLPQQREGKAEWTPFATIKTSGFEQYLGVQAASWCQRSQFVQDKDEDLSSTLQNRLDSMR